MLPISRSRSKAPTLWIGGTYNKKTDIIKARWFVDPLTKLFPTSLRKGNGPQEFPHSLAMFNENMLFLTYEGPGTPVNVKTYGNAYRISTLEDTYIDTAPTNIKLDKTLFPDSIFQSLKTGIVQPEAFCRKIEKIGAVNMYLDFFYSGSKCIPCSSGCGINSTILAEYMHGVFILPFCSVDCARHYYKRIWKQARFESLTKKSFAGIYPKIDFKNLSNKIFKEISFKTFGKDLPLRYPKWYTAIINKIS